MVVSSQFSVVSSLLSAVSNRLSASVSKVLNLASEARSREVVRFLAVEATSGCDSY